MKKILSLALCTIMAISLLACGGEPEPTFAEKIAQDATTGSISVEITSAVVTKDNSGGDAAVVTYKFINNTNKSRQFKTSTNCSVKQGDTKLENAVVTIGDVYKEGVATKSVEPESSLDVQICYKLIDATTPLSITCNIMSGEDKATVEKEMSIS